MLEEEGADGALIELFSGIKHSPSVPAFLLSIGKVLLPALRDFYQAYLEASDSIADGPTHRFLSLALSEKAEQIKAFEQWAEAALSENSELRGAAVAWTQAVGNRLSEIGGVRVRYQRSGLCQDRELTSFLRTPPEIRVSCRVDSIGPTSSIPAFLTAKAYDCSSAPPSVT